MATHSLRGKGGRFVRAPRPTNLLNMRKKDLFEGALLAYGASIVEGVHESIYQTAGDIEDWMKENAVWGDRTGDARDGLTASVDSNKLKPTIYIYHTVPYGVWLEVRWSGRYAIIVPAIEHWGPLTMERLKAVI